MYIDGVTQNLHSSETGNPYRASNIKLPDKTRLIGFHCKDNGVVYGLAASVSVPMWSGDRAVYTVTDTDWTCSGVAESGWETLDFKETSNWKPAVYGNTEVPLPSDIDTSARWIWGDPGGEGSDVYCRKDTDIKSFAKCKFRTALPYQRPI